MEPPPPLLLFAVVLLLLASFSLADLSSCPDSSSLRSSKAAYSVYPNFRAACGYYDYGSIINDGRVAGVVGRLYNNGRGCGACYHVACTDKQFCDPDGITVVVTDQGYADAGIDFVLSYQAFGDLALEGFSDELLDLGIVDVQYKRVSCKYSKQNLVIKVMEQSSNPSYLAIVFLYQDGKYDIIDVEVSPATGDCDEWISLHRAYGAVWDLENTPSGPLNVRFLAMNSKDKTKWFKAKNSIPGNWLRGAIYDTGIQLSSDSSSSATE